MSVASPCPSFALPSPLFSALSHRSAFSQMIVARSRSPHRPDPRITRTGACHPANRPLTRRQSHRLERRGHRGCPLNDPSHPKRSLPALLRQKGRESGFAWSPDSKKLAFFSNCTPTTNRPSFWRVPDRTPLPACWPPSTASPRTCNGRPTASCSASYM